MDEQKILLGSASNDYKAVMKRGGPKGIFSQAIVDEYESAMKEETKPELETKKINISFLKKGKTNG